ncbi:MAG: glycerophosphodiester phosphodiesterase family protein [Actinobacteria bacterium]|nr:glycerophosphodiester phosphodiesterase family protein [Actinomycetota bacterium]
MKIYAHRGASHDFPEMTMAAYEAAVKQGADGFECDLRLTKDGVAVLWHDIDLLRCANDKAVVSGSTYAQLKSIYPQILTLEEFLDFGISEKKSLLLETKHPVPSRTAVEDEVVEKLNREEKRIKKADISVNVMSFSWLAIEHIKRLDSKIETTYLLHDHTPWISARYSSAQSLGPGISLLRKDPALAKRIKSSGRKLNVWTVNDPADIRLCNELGVDNLITNRPGFARELLRNL